MKKIRRALRRQLNILLGRDLAIRQTLNLSTEFHGSEYGGWAVLCNSLGPDARVVSVGIGEDASFDLALIDQYGCDIHAFDPTPKSAAWVKANVATPHFRFEPVALGGEDGTLRLFFPKNADYVSASCRPGDHVGDDYFDAVCLTLPSLLDRIGFSAVDVFKMDIEGAEYAVIRQAVESGAISRVKQLLVEFHHCFSGFSVADTLAAIQLLQSAGFGVAWVSTSGHEVLFVRQDK